MADLPARITGGVDTHKDLHVAAALDDVGKLLGTQSFPTTAAGYRALLAWLRGFGTVVAVGVEGTGSWGAGLARHLAATDVKVLEVNRPNRQHRRRRASPTRPTPRPQPGPCWPSRPRAPPRPPTA